MWFFVENQIPVSKLGWETRNTGKFGLFWGPLFTWDFSNIGSIIKKICAVGKNPSRQPLFKKEAEKNPSETLYRCDFSWRIGLRCRNWGEKPGTQSNLGFFGTTFHLRFFQHRVNFLKKKCPRKKSVPPGIFYEGSRKKPFRDPL